MRGESTDHALMVSGDGEGLVDAADVGLLDGAGVVRYTASYTIGRVAAQRHRRGRRAGGHRRQPEARAELDDRDRDRRLHRAGRRGEKPLATDPSDARLDVFPRAAVGAHDDRPGRREARRGHGVRQHEHVRPEDRPAAALDGDPTTAWETQAFGDARGQCIESSSTSPITTDHVNLVQPLTGDPNR